MCYHRRSCHAAILSVLLQHNLDSVSPNLTHTQRVRNVHPHITQHRQHFEHPRAVNLLLLRLKSHVNNLAVRSVSCVARRPEFVSIHYQASVMNGYKPGETYSTDITITATNFIALSEHRRSQPAVNSRITSIFDKYIAMHVTLQ